jgi:hypothetical protein
MELQVLNLFIHVRNEQLQARFHAQVVEEDTRNTTSAHSSPKDINVRIIGIHLAISKVTQVRLRHEKVQDLHVRNDEILGWQFLGVVFKNRYANALPSRSHSCPNLVRGIKVHPAKTNINIIKTKLGGDGGERGEGR